MSVRQSETMVDDPSQPVVWPERFIPGREAGWWHAVIGASGAAGIVLVSVSFALARANGDLNAARFLLWAGLAAIAAPALARLISEFTDRTERIVIVVSTAVLLYSIKVLHDPVRLFFADEFFHLANSQRLAETGRLFGENLLLPVSADYPGLSVVTVALSELSGLGLFASALVVIGLAKAMLSLALFLLFERLSGSARVAGLGALLYCAHPNYLLWSSQFSYESLSLPLLVVVLVCLVARNGAPRAQQAAWSAIGCLVAVAVALTHHLTAYAMVVLLWAHAALAWRSRKPELRPAIAMAAAATLASVLWATIAAGGTSDYLGEIFTRFFGAVSTAASETSSTRVPFQSGAAVDTTVAGPPLDDRVLAVGSVLLVALAVAGGLLAARRRTWTDPLVLIFGLAAVAAVGAYPLRVFPGAWEVANRTSEFLFLGVALMAAVGALAFADGVLWERRVPALVAAGVIAIAGGVIVGWPREARLPRPYTAAVDDARIEAQGPRLADWARTHLPAGSRFVANDTDGRLLAVAGFDHVWAGTIQGVTPVLTYDVLPQWVWDFLRDNRIEYVVVDRRVSSRDNLVGYFYPRPADVNDPPISNWRNVRRKFERLPQRGRIYDSGDIVVYDIRRPLERPEPPPDA